MLKVGLVGTGLIATQKHLPAWRKLRGLAAVAALCDVNVERAQQVSGQFAVPKLYDDLQTMLQMESPDVVDICTPPQTHAALAISALRAGAHVLIEKPMAVSIEECDTIIGAASETGREVCTCHSDLFYPAFVKTQKLFHQGMIGKFRGMRIFLSTPVDYMTSNSDHWAHRLPGGVIGETGPHAIYLTLAFINPIRDVHVQAQKILPEFPWSAFEDYRIDLVGENAVSSAILTYSTKQWAAVVEVWGSEGHVKVDLESQSIVCYRRSQLTPLMVALSALSEAAQAMKSVLWSGVSVFTGLNRSTHDVLIRQFVESIRNGTEPPVTASHGREAVRVMNLIVEQLRQTTG